MNALRRTPLTAGFAIILLANTIALIGVRYNRMSAEGGRLVLTERELEVQAAPSRDRENNGLILRLDWSPRVGPDDPPVGGTGVRSPLTAAWLGRAELARLGFDVSRRMGDPDFEQFYARQQPRAVFLALEGPRVPDPTRVLDGPAFTAWIASLRREAVRDSEFSAKAQAAQGRGVVSVAPRTPLPNGRGLDPLSRIEEEERNGSRLFVVDADVDLEALRARHPRDSGHVIMRGTVRPVVHSSGGDVRGQIALLTESVNIPRAYRTQIVPAGRGRGGQRWAAPFVLRLDIGRKGEPWIHSVSPRPVRK